MERDGPKYLPIAFFHFYFRQQIYNAESAEKQQDIGQKNAESV